MDVAALIDAALDELKKIAGDSNAGAIGLLEKAAGILAGGEVEPAPEPGLSVLTLTALSRSVAEGDPGASPKVIAFEVSRTGDASLVCSVHWDKTGTTDAGDFVAGQAFHGDLTWDAGDAAPQKIEFALQADKAQESDELIVVRLSNPVDATLAAWNVTVTVRDDDDAQAPAPAPGKSVLPGWNEQWLDSSVKPITVSNNSQLRAAYAAIKSGGTIICDRPGNYGSLPLNESKAVCIKAEVPIYTTKTPRTAPFFNPSLRKSGVNDTALVKWLFNDSITPKNERIVMNPQPGGSSGDVMLDGIHIDAGGSWQPSPSWAGRLWVRRCYTADKKSQNWSTTGNAYGSRRREVVHEECWLWADGVRDAGDGGPSAYTDYGNITHLVDASYYESCVFEGTCNHSISNKAKCGRPSGIWINRNVFAGFSNKINAGNFVYAQLGQNNDNYVVNGRSSKTGDNTCGYATVTNNTFMDWTGFLNKGRASQMCVRMQNCVGALIEGNEFWPENEWPIVCWEGDWSSSGHVGSPRPWTKGVIIRKNTFRASRTLHIRKASKEYGPLTVTLEDNAAPGGLMTINNKAGAKIVRVGNNTGFA
jgi:hypothetical protein